MVVKHVVLRVKVKNICIWKKGISKETSIHKEGLRSLEIILWGRGRSTEKEILTSLRVRNTWPAWD